MNTTKYEKSKQYWKQAGTGIHMEPWQEQKGNGAKQQIDGEDVGHEQLDLVGVKSQMSE